MGCVKKAMHGVLGILLSASVIIMSLGSSFGSVVSEAADSRVESAISWAIATAADDTHGYSQSSRWGPDYDCSSFVISAFSAGGFGITTGSGYTGNMISTFKGVGFSYYSWSSIGTAGLQRGDILLRISSSGSNHTEIYLGDAQVVGAHSDRGNAATGDQDGTEVSTESYYEGGWTGVLRYDGTGTTEEQTVEIDPTTGLPTDFTTDYAGVYTVTTSSSPLALRMGPGTTYATITSIPKGTQVSVTAGNGEWAYLTYGSSSGYSSMAYLTLVSVTQERMASGTLFDVGKFTYMVTKSNAKKGKYEVSVISFNDDTATSAKIRDTVTAEDGTVYKVTEIGEKAFKGLDELKKVTIGKNVKKIGAKAFMKCTSLKKVIFKGKNVTSIGEKAFKKTAKKMKVYLPKKKFKKYRKLLYAAGISGKTIYYYN